MAHRNLTEVIKGFCFLPSAAPLFVGSGTGSETLEITRLPAMFTITNPLTALFLCNDAPSSSQAATIRQEIHEISSAISSMDAEIAQLQAGLKDPWQLKEALEARLKTLKVVNHPVVIFGICVDEDVRPNDLMMNPSESDEFPPRSLDSALGARPSLS